VATKKLSKKALKQPDQFVGFWQIASDRLSRFVTQNAKTLVIGASALATVVVGMVVTSYVNEGREARASSALDRAQKIAAADLTPGATATKDSIPHFPTDKARAEGALKDLDDHFGKRGALSDEAATYEKLLSSRLDARLKFLAREGLGYALERKGKLPEAKETFAKLGTDAASLGDFYKDRARYHEARLAELQGNPGEAAKIYHEVLDKNPTTSLREEISSRLALLELK